MKQIGIDIVEAPLAANVVFGPTGIPGGNFDIAEFAEITARRPR